MDEHCVDALPDEVASYLASHHVMSLATAAGAELWTANLFYCFEKARVRLLFYTNPATRHGRLALAEPRVAATICGQQRDVSRLSGIQLEGRATMLAGPDAEAARGIFAECFPDVGANPSPIWELRLERIALTDNSISFGHRVHWPR